MSDDGAHAPGEQRVLRWLGHALLALLDIQSAGLVHQDVAARNMLFADAARTHLVLSDLGVAAPA